MTEFGASHADTSVAGVDLLEQAELQGDVDDSDTYSVQGSDTDDGEGEWTRVA